MSILELFKKFQYENYSLTFKMGFYKIDLNKLFYIYLYVRNGINNRI
jgi:hypothetical protein